MRICFRVNTQDDKKICVRFLPAASIHSWVYAAVCIQQCSGKCFTSKQLLPFGFGEHSYISQNTWDINHMQDNIGPEDHHLTNIVCY